MADDITVILEDRPGTLAEMGNALGQAGINILGGCGMPYGGKGMVHILVDNAAAARDVLREAGMDVRSERPVLIVDVEDRPGALGNLAEKIARAGANIEVMYLNTGGQVVLGVDDMEKARAAL